jgi:hypothetical protein
MLFRDRYDLVHAMREGGYQLHTRIPEPIRYKEMFTGSRTLGGVLHFQHAEWQRVMFKQTLYQMVEILRWGRIHANYVGTVDETGCELSPVPPSWFGGDPARLFRLGEAPWQKAEVLRLLAKHGPDRFAQCSLLPRALELVEVTP